MNRNFARSEIVTPERLSALQRRADGPGLRRLGAQSALYFASAAGLLLIHDPVLLAPTFVVSAAVQFGMFGMLHEACHQTAFASRSLSLLAGWVAALAQPMTPALMRAFHFEHHRHTHELARDPELAGMPFMVRWPRHVIWLLTLTGLPVLMARFGWTLFAALNPPGALWEKVLPFVKPDKRGRIAWEARGLVLIHGGLLLAAALVYPPIARIYAAMLAGHALLSFYITCEHRGLPEGGTILERTRSLETPAVVRWLLWNMPYHAEHHGWPAVPFHALGDLHAEVRDHLPNRVSPLYLHLHRGNRP